jgi:hypothetical protein
VEYEAYSSHIQAVYEMENKDHKTALDNLIKSKIIYEKTSQYKDSLEAIIYKEKVNQLDTLIRLCSFQLRGMMSSENEEKLIAEMVKDYPLKKEIEDKITKVKQETKKEQIEKIEEITYGNKTVPLKTEKLKAVFKRVETHMLDIQAFWEGHTQEASTQISNLSYVYIYFIENYLQLVNILEDAIIVIKKEKAEESKKNEQSGQLYNILISYIQKIKLQSSVDRNVLQATTLAKKISLDLLFSNTKLQSELRPQNIVRFIEKALKAQRSIVNMEKD